MNSGLNDVQNETATLRFKESSVADTSVNEPKYWAYQDDSVVYPSIAENSDADVRIPKLHVVAQAAQTLIAHLGFLNTGFPHLPGGRELSEKCFLWASVPATGKEGN